MEARVPHELKRLPEQAHAASPLFNYMRYHWVLANMPRGMTEEQIGKYMAYGAHASANKERNFQEIIRRTDEGGACCHFTYASGTSPSRPLDLTAGSDTTNRENVTPNL